MSGSRKDLNPCAWQAGVLVSRMVYHLCMRFNYGPAIQCLRSIWPAPCGARIKPVVYDELDKLKTRPGLYIFTDMELLDEASRVRAVELHTRLKSRPDLYRVWNDPARSTRRFDLLERLWEEKSNSFRAYRLAEGTAPPTPEGMRYPVFLRDENLHRGPLTPLLHNAEEVRAAAAGLRAPGPCQNTGPMLAVEFLDYAGTDGVYRKYSYVRMGEELVPKHVLFSKGWAVKQPEKGQFDSAPWLEEEWAFLRSRPHEEAVRKIFDDCALDYGRIDYTVAAGRIEVFEMNSNPMMLQPTHFDPIPRRPVHVFAREHFLRIIEKNDMEGAPPLLDRLRWRLRRPKIDDIPWRHLKAKKMPAINDDHD